MKRTGIVKKIQAALIMLACPFATFASQDGGEDYHPFVVEGKTWTCQETHWKDIFPTSYETIYTIMGDTVINGESCKKLFIKHTSWSNRDYSYIGALIEQDKKVYFMKNEIMQKRLLYDFSLEEVGDGFVRDDPAEILYISLVAEKIISLYGKTYRQMEIITRPNNNYEDRYEYKDIWIEGVGSITNPLLFYLRSDDGFYHVKTCYENGECIFDRDEYLAAYPDGITSTTTHQKANFPVFDLQGRRLNGVPQRGIYIRDGRKYVVK